MNRKHRRRLGTRIGLKHTIGKTRLTAMYQPPVQYVSLTCCSSSDIDNRFEEEQRRQDWSENQQYQHQSSYGSHSSQSSEQRTPSSDPMGYYAALGVPKDASVQEIQSAFRGLAMKWRKLSYSWRLVTSRVDATLLPELNSFALSFNWIDPDRFSTPEEKAKGKKKFQEITAAYSVLRDGKEQTVSLIKRSWIPLFDRALYYCFTNTRFLNPSSISCTRTVVKKRKAYDTYGRA